MRSVIRCSCGQRIFAKDVVQTGYYLRLVGPSFVYIKYRCSRCKKLGEQFVKQEEWEGGILCDTKCELTPEEQKRFERMGPIDIHECIDAHFELEEIETVGDLLSRLQEAKR